MALHVSQQRPNDKVFSPFAGASPVVAHGDGDIRGGWDDPDND